MSKSKKPDPKMGRPEVSVKIATTSIGMHPTALERLTKLAKAKHMSRSALIVQSLIEHFPSVFEGL
jgi:predicted DNA-binding protein